MKTCVLICAAFLVVLGNARAQLHTESVGYKSGDTVLKGYLAYDAAAKGQRPGVLVVHEWWGLNEYAKARAEQLARLGYVAFAVDMYGNGQIAGTAEEAGTFASKVKGDRKLMRERAQAGLAVLLSQALTEMSPPSRFWRSRRKCARPA